MDFVIDKDEIVIQIAEASKQVQASAPPVEDLILDQVLTTAEHNSCLIKIVTMMPLNFASKIREFVIKMCIG